MKVLAVVLVLGSLGALGAWTLRAAPERYRRAWLKDCATCRPLDDCEHDWARLP